MKTPVHVFEFYQASKDQKVFVIAKDLHHASSRLQQSKMHDVEFVKSTPCSSHWDGMFDHQSA
mgnify:CR=1 FL=1